jgi:hypothetical protein
LPSGPGKAADGHWPGGEAEALLEARVGHTVYVAREQVALEVERQIAGEHQPVLVPEDALPETGTLSPRPLLRSRFRSARERTRRRTATFRSVAAVLATVLLIVTAIRYKTASRAVTEANDSYADARTALEQAASAEAELDAEQAAAQELQRHVTIPASSLLHAVVAVAQPDDAIYRFQYRGFRFTVSGRFERPQELSSALSSLVGISGVTVTTTITDGIAESTISGRLGE